MSVLASREQAHAWDLRSAWATQREVVVVLDEGCLIPRVRGTVEHVAPTGAFVRIHDGAATPWHVPCALILAVRKPHFHEPLDEPVQLALDVEPMPGQMPLFESS